MPKWCVEVLVEGQREDNFKGRKIKRTFYRPHDGAVTQYWVTVVDDQFTIHVRSVDEEEGVDFTTESPSQAPCRLLPSFTKLRYNPWQFLALSKEDRIYCRDKNLERKRQMKGSHTQTSKKRRTQSQEPSDVQETESTVSAAEPDGEVEAAIASLVQQEEACIMSCIRAAEEIGMSPREMFEPLSQFFSVEYRDLYELVDYSEIDRE
ncbi:hypothetical protein Gasu2_33400 [Galdieria sulphuraria]|uniref:Uncharacterized protein n=1 Tax=Galdieria sulphuraria TaxID=130081 RepID=M2VS36_GALSU|nr:uncharacterized protein Gasu_64250 [Galdieria sulphuraria]EME25916.1 hypothetical protein Gasu_64250 [Galdieria sulphuraria]GJD09068.1 hypothetical protein Gasu2_33400 [Galdieria sulphuraria]|eukprot:XP_005702436.1 hypothetical protein Gasu_64250 [Galdieria sulphuraria]